MLLSEFYTKCWSRYVQLTPDATRIHQLLTERGEDIVNDHVAFRTFNLPGMSRLEVGAVFEKWGYQRAPEELDFPEKKLKANYYLHPDARQPKVFISELLLEHFSKELQDWIQGVVKNRFHGASRTLSAETLLQPTWAPIEFQDYQKFYSTSEYAAWTAAFGIQLNHFTVSFNSLKTFKTIQDLNSFLKASGLVLNAAGGEVKGTPQDLLEQSSTEARKVPCIFAGGVTQNVMGCYYEFARRYPLPGSEQLFQGFIPKSANKIFESTYEKQKN